MLVHSKQTNKQTNKRWETKLRAQLDPLVLQLSDHHQSSFCMVLKHAVNSYELTIPETVLIQPSWSEGKQYITVTEKLNQNCFEPLVPNHPTSAVQPSLH